MRIGANWHSGRSHSASTESTPLNMAPSSRQLCVKNINAIFFDLDNTLIPTRRADKETITKIQCHLVEEYGVPVSEAVDITETFLNTFRSYSEHPQMSLDEWRISLWKEALGKYHQFAEEIYPLWLNLRFELLHPDDGVLSMLQCLKRQYLLALITNGFSRSQWEKVRRLELEEYFNIIIVSGDTCWEKPNKGIFLVACEQLDVSPNECIMIGDRLDTDILGGQNAELGATVWVPIEETRCSNVDVTPDAIIQHATILPSILKPARRDLGRYLALSEPESENSNSSEIS